MGRAKLEEAIKIAREKAGATHARWWDITPEFLDLVFDAASAHLATLPKTKMVEVWHVTAWDAETDRLRSEACFSRKDAEDAAGLWRMHFPQYGWPTVIGPHLQEIPA